MFDGLYNPFMVIRGMVYDCHTNIITIIYIYIVITCNYTNREKHPQITINEWYQQAKTIYSESNLSYGFTNITGRHSPLPLKTMLCAAVEDTYGDFHRRLKTC